MFNLKLYQEWVSFINLTEDVFKELGYLKVHTPSLVKSPSMEAYLEGFKIQDSDFYLPTSPEFALKKLWTKGGAFSKIFEISKSFRAGEEDTPLHLPEFTMVEIYESEISVKDFQSKLSTALKKILNLSEETSFENVNLIELIEILTGFKWSAKTTKEDLQMILNSLSIGWFNEDSLNDLFQRLYLEFIEPSLNPNSFIFLSPFPDFLSALAKINPDGHADRFELFFNGVEIANGYNELLDSRSTLERWKSENLIREELGKTPHPIDTDLIEALADTKVHQGVGVAIGLERLFYVKKLIEGEKLKSLNFYD